MDGRSIEENRHGQEDSTRIPRQEKHAQIHRQRFGEKHKGHEEILMLKCRHAWLVLTGRIVICPERMEFDMSLDKTLAAVAALSAAADRLIAKASADESALSQAQSDLAAADSAAAAVIQPVVDTINAAAPAAPEASPEAPVE